MDSIRPDPAPVPIRDELEYLLGSLGSLSLSGGNTPQHTQKPLHVPHGDEKDVICALPLNLDKTVELYTEAQEIETDVAPPIEESSALCDSTTIESFPSAIATFDKHIALNSLKANVSDHSEQSDIESEASSVACFEECIVTPSISLKPLLPVCEEPPVEVAEFQIKDLGAVETDCVSGDPVGPAVLDTRILPDVELQVSSDTSKQTEMRSVTPQPDKFIAEQLTLSATLSPNIDAFKSAVCICHLKGTVGFCVGGGMR